MRRAIPKPQITGKCKKEQPTENKNRTYKLSGGLVLTISLPGGGDSPLCPRQLRHCVQVNGIKSAKILCSQLLTPKRVHLLWHRYPPWTPPASLQSGRGRDCRFLPSRPWRRCRTFLASVRVALRTCSAPRASRCPAWCCAHCSKKLN